MLFPEKRTLNPGGDGLVVRLIYPCSQGPGFETTFRLATKERISQHSVIPGKGQKESRGVVTSRGRTRVARLDYSTFLVGFLCFSHKPIPYEDCKRICLLTINALLNYSTCPVGSLCLAHKPISSEDCKRISTACHS